MASELTKSEAKALQYWRRMRRMMVVAKARKEKAKADAKQIEALKQEVRALSAVLQLPFSSPQEWQIESGGRCTKLTPTVLHLIWIAHKSRATPTEISKKLGVSRSAVIRFVTGWSNTAAAMFTYRQLGIVPEWQVQQEALLKKQGKKATQSR